MSRKAIGITVVIALVPALIYLVHDAVGGSKSPSSPASSLTPIPPVTTPTTTPIVTPTTPSVSKSPTVKPPAQPHLKHVAIDVPRRLLSKGLLNVGFDNSVEPHNGAFRAGSTAEAARWGSRGEPGMPAKDTVYIIGKSLTKGVSAFDTLPKIKKGATIVIRTDSGDLTYRVRSIGTQTAAGLARTSLFTTKAPGRLVVVGIGYNRSGKATGKVFVVVAEITATAAR